MQVCPECGCKYGDNPGTVWICPKKDNCNFAWCRPPNDPRTGEARDPLLVEREKTHGSFTKTAEIAQQLKKIVHIHSSPEIKIAQVEALSMICTKIARILSGNPNEKEHYLDIAGYAKLGAEACDNG